MEAIERADETYLTCAETTSDADEDGGVADDEDFDEERVGDYQINENEANLHTPVVLLFRRRRCCTIVQSLRNLSPTYADLRYRWGTGPASSGTFVLELCPLLM